MNALSWEMVARASLHPIQVRILDLVLDGSRHSPTEMAELLELPLPNTSYHVRKLSALGLLKPAGTRQVRGAIEHFYRIAPWALK